MAVETQQIIDEAEKLGKLVAQHPAIARYKQAQKAIADDAEATRLFAEFERAMIRERVNAGLARAKAKGVKLGRRPVSRKIEARILELRATGIGMLKIARQLGIGTIVVQRVVAA